MNPKPIIDTICEEIKQNLTVFCEKHNFERLTPEVAEKMSQGISHAMASGSVVGFRSFLQQFESEADTIVHEGETMRLKMVSQKKFITPFGEMTLPRKLYQADCGGKTHVPLDAAWGMEDQFATIEVREAVLYSCGLITPTETETMLKKCALFHPSSTAIKNMVNNIGEWFEAHADAMREQMKANTVVPKKTRVLAASLDGVNVPLRESGLKRGRPGERPGKMENTWQRTTYKNAMVGSLTCYGDVPDGEKSPVRLASRYLARMPEDRAPTFKTAFEAELDTLESALPENVSKVLVCDAARGLWKYIEENKRFDDYEKIVDYFHVIEHLSSLSEALFGKQSDAGKKWYDQYREKLLNEEGTPLAILRSVDYYLKNKTLSKSARETVLRERTFFRRNKHRMTYADFRQRGLPIGSGVVEAACKSIVKSRLCRSGMRWTRKGGQHILHLRTQIKSGQWDNGWNAYKELKKTG